MEAALRRRGHIPSILTLLSGLLLVAASLLPWVCVGNRSSGHFFAIWNVAGWRYTGYLAQGALGGGTPGDPRHLGGVGTGYGDITLVAGIGIIVLTVAGYHHGWRWRWAAPTIALAVISATAPILVLLSVRHGNDNMRVVALGEQADYGLWLALGMDAAIVLLGLLTCRRSRNSDALAGSMAGAA